jgi:hypothetical protein
MRVLKSGPNWGLLIVIGSLFLLQTPGFIVATLQAGRMTRTRLRRRQGR